MQNVMDWKNYSFCLVLVMLTSCGNADNKKEEHDKEIYKSLVEQPYYYKIGSSARHYHAARDCPFLTECKGVLDTISFKRAEMDSGFHCCERCADDMFKDISN